MTGPVESKPSQRLSPRETATDRLVRAYREQGDIRARDRVVQIYLPLVDTFARRYESAGAAYDQLMRVGSAALSHAIERYVPRRGGEFIGFAAPIIVQRIKELPSDRVATVTTGFDLRDERLQLMSGFRSLDPMEREIVRLRFVEDLSGAETASRLDISPDQLARQTRVALAKLRRKLERLGSGRPPGARDPDPFETPAEPTSLAAHETVSHSGRLLLRMSPSLHTRLAAASQQEAVSLNHFITRSLAARVGWDEDDDARDGGSTPREAPRPRWLPAVIIGDIVVVAIAGVLGVALLLDGWPGA
jgi:RNA polymerase sigma factor (sigma-70 family)